MNLTFTTNLFFQYSKRWLKISFFAAMMLTFSNSAFSQAGIWRDVNASDMTGTGKTDIIPEKFRAVTFDMSALKSYLSQAPMEVLGGTNSKNFYFTFPMPDGTNQKFYIVESPVMAESLAAQFPEIKTYAGQGIDDPTATVRFDYTPFGFHGMILSAYGSYFIDPYYFMETTYYVCYDKKDYFPNRAYPTCATKSEDFIDLSNSSQEVERNYQPNLNPVANKSNGTQLRTYRLALACTGEYAATKGGTIPGALAGMTTSINRVDGIYEREMAIRMVLIANTSSLIYVNAATDPYTNNNGSTMLGQNQTNITSIIGTANYDIGHVFSTGGGGIAGLGVVCNSSQKARGVTGLPNPVGDAFDVDFVAHEMGHQFGGDHTFNCETSNCGGGNRSFTAAYEPGSGSTIMAYAGICSPNDLQNHSDPYFHTKSFDQIYNYSHNTAPSQGGSCPVTTSTGNTPPVISAGANYTIPDSTAFRLTGSATDADPGDTITYCWEEYDLGGPSNWNTATGNSPIFRTFNPTISPTRIFPKLSNILTGIRTIGEYMPTYPRVLHFKLTCRDNKFGGGGVTNNDIPVQVNVVGTQPFLITSPNIVGISYPAYTLQTVTWNIANTTVSPINTSNVNIYLSIDGGLTFPIPLGTNVPNNGSYQWWTPSISTSTARIMVEGAGNIFFDINDKNFTLNAVGIPENELANSISVYPNPGNNQFNFAMDNNSFGNVVVNVFDKLGQLVSHQMINKTGKQVNCKLDMNNTASGIYTVEFTFNEGKAVKRLVKL